MQCISLSMHIISFSEQRGIDSRTKIKLSPFFWEKKAYRLFVCLFVGIKSEKLYSASSWEGSKPPGSDYTRAKAQSSLKKKGATKYSRPSLRRKGNLRSGWCALNRTCFLSSSHYLPFDWPSHLIKELNTWSPCLQPRPACSHVCTFVCAWMCVDVRGCVCVCVCMCLGRASRSATWTWVWKKFYLWVCKLTRANQNDHDFPMLRLSGSNNFCTSDERFLAQTKSIDRQTPV